MSAVVTQVRRQDLRANERLANELLERAYAEREELRQTLDHPAAQPKPPINSLAFVVWAVAMVMIAGAAVILFKLAGWMAPLLVNAIKGVFA